MSSGRAVPSLFRRLVLMQLVIVTAAISLLCLRAYYQLYDSLALQHWPPFFAEWIARLEADNTDPARAGVMARNIAQVATEGLEGPRDDVVYKVWRANGVVLAQSQAMAWPAPASIKALASDDHAWEQSGWYIGTAWSPNHAVVAAVAIDYHLQRMIGEIWLKQGMSYLVVMVSVLGASWVAMRFALQPLRRLATSIAHRPPGDLTALDAAGGPRELQPIIDSFNTLLAQFRSLLETERAFIANAAHELRTPIAAISAQAHVLIAEPDDSGRRMAAAALQLGVRRSARVIQRLLLLSKLDTAPGQFQPESGDIAVMIREVVRTQLERVHSRGQQLSLQLQELPRRYFRDALATALECLIDNAIRYAPGARIEVVARAEDHETVITVADEGPGIPAELRSRAFNRFDRLGRSDEEGSGLGLAIVLHVSQLHGGSVQLRSPTNGIGSVFEMRLPLPEI